MKHFLFALSLFLLNPLVPFSNDDLIILDKFNNKKLERLLLQEINAYRSTQKLSSLFDNQIIYKAAKDQIDYIIENNELTHDQKNPEKASVLNRVHFYAKRNPSVVSENISKIMVMLPLQYLDEKGLKKETRVSTYKEAARQIFLSWLNSPIHLRNLSISEMQLAGTAVHLNATSKELIVVQVYARF
jgi:uncharacterized protein YkwD